MPKEIGVGVLGYSIGKVHSHAWRSVGEYFYPIALQPRLVALSGRTPKAVELESRKYGYQRTYQDWKKVVRDPDVEIVDNCLPVMLHPEPMIMAAKLGKHLFCEKPLARRAADAKAMLNAAEKAKVRHMVGYNYRFIPAVILAQNMIREGALGDIFHFSGAYLTTNSGYDSKESPMRWQFEGKMSGYGALADLGTHALDLARFLVGEVSSVSGASATYIPERPVTEGAKRKARVDVDDLTVACMKFANGALGVLETSWLNAGRMDFLRFEVYGSLGTLRFNLERINELEIFLTRESDNTSGFRTLNVMTKNHPFVKQYWPNQGGGVGWEHSFVNEMHHYLVAIAEDKPIGPHGATFYDGYRNCLIMDGIADSARNGRWVNIPS